MLTFRTARLAAFALLVGLPLSGCFDTFAEPYDGPPLVEFAQVGGQYSATVNQTAGTVQLPVNLIGPQQGSPITINVRVDEASTAVEGTHYSFPDGAQVTIPANSNTGFLNIDIINGGLPAEATATGTLIMELEGSADGSIQGAENLDDFTLTIRGAPPAS